MIGHTTISEGRDAVERLYAHHAERSQPDPEYLRYVAGLLRMLCDDLSRCGWELEQRKRSDSVERE